MNITILRPDGCRFAAAVPYEGAQYVKTGQPACACGGSTFAGVRGTRDSSDRHMEEDAGCCECGAKVGRIRVDFDTLFGIEEDERVLRGRCRVY